MSAAFHLSPVDADQIEQYPIPEDEDVKGHRFVMFDHDRWLNSATFLKMGPEVGWYHLNLIFLAQKQRPIGTLPDDDEELALMLRLDLGRWKELRSRAMGPLHKWTRVRVGNRFRLGHPVVTKIAMETVEGRHLRAKSNDEKAIYQRLKRIREGLIDLGCDRTVVGDEVLIQRLDAWLLDNVTGKRTKASYERAMMHAAAQKWLVRSVSG